MKAGSHLKGEIVNGLGCSCDSCLTASLAYIKFLTLRCSVECRCLGVSHPG